MQKKHAGLLALSILLTTLVGILSNLASGQVPLFLQPVLHFTWPLLIFFTVILIIVGILVEKVKAPGEQKPLPKNQNRQRLLVRVHNIWIRDFLEQSLYRVGIISLKFHEHPVAVAPPRPNSYSTIDRSMRSPSGTTDIERAYSDAEEQLLILGEPGVGKTTLLLQLMQKLLEHAKVDEASPVPVIFFLSSWAIKRQPLIEWLIEELHSAYCVPTKLGRAWIENDHILPLLDGLDEVDSKYRAACVAAINTFIREHGLISVVVCSRMDEYFHQSARLSLQNAIVIEPLTQQQVDTYCLNAGKPLEGVRRALQDDPSLRELVTTPLMLSVLTNTFSDQPVDTLYQQSNNLRDRRTQLFTAYLDHQLERKGVNSLYTKQQTVLWLTWLAHQLSEHNHQTLFYLERMQPSWLPEGGLRRLIAGSPRVIIAGLIASLVPLFVIPGSREFYGVGSGQYVYSSVIGMFILGVWIGLIYMLGDDGDKAEIKLFEVINWDWRLTWNATVREAHVIWADLLKERDRRKFRLSSMLVRVLTGLGWIVGIGLIFGLFAAFFYQNPHVAGILGTHWRFVWPGFSRLGFALFLGPIIILGLVIDLIMLRILYYAAIGFWKLLVKPFVEGVSVSALDDRKRTRANVGVWRSALNGFSLSLLAGASVGLLFGHFVSMQYGLLVGLDVMVLVWLLCGGYGCFQHLLLRLLLRVLGYAPLNYPRFLDYAAKRNLLHKVGGRYLFFHDRFQEYLTENMGQLTVCKCGYKEYRSSAKFCPNCGKPIEIEDKRIYGWPWNYLVLATIVGTVLHTATHNIFLRFLPLGFFAPSFLIVAYFGAAFGSGVGVLVGGLGYFFSQTLFHPFHYSGNFLVTTSIGFVAGFAQFLARGRYNTLRPLFLSGILGAVGIILGVGGALSVSNQLSMANFGVNTWLNILICLLVLPLFLLIHDRVSMHIRSNFPAKLWRR